MAARAIHREARIAVRKAQVIASLIRGRTLPDAYAVLAQTPRRASKMFSLLLRSAQHNAEQDDPAADAERMVVLRVVADKGPHRGFKARRRRHRRQNSPIPTRTSHLKVELAMLPEEEGG